MTILSIDASVYNIPWCTRGDVPELNHQRWCTRGYAPEVKNHRWCTRFDAPELMHQRWWCLAKAVYKLFKNPDKMEWEGVPKLHCNVTRITKPRPTVLEAKIINVLSDERCELWHQPSVSRNLVPQCLIFYQISQLVAIRDWYLPKFRCQPNGRRMSKFEIAICIPPAPASATFCPFQIFNSWNLYENRDKCKLLFYP